MTSQWSQTRVPYLLRNLQELILKLNRLKQDNNKNKSQK